MNDKTPLGTAVAVLRSEIAAKQTLLAGLEAMIAGPSPRAGPRKRRSGIGAAAAEILRQTARPMHGLRELIPALEAQGHVIASRAGFATLLLRNSEIERRAPGTFALKKEGDT